MYCRQMSKIGVFFERHSCSSRVVDVSSGGRGCGCWVGRIQSTSASFGEASNNSRLHWRHQAGPASPEAPRNKSDAEATTGAVVPASLVSCATDVSCLIKNNAGKELGTLMNLLRGFIIQ